MKPDDQIAWCLRQKSGTRLVEPNSNLSKAYVSMANESLRSLQVNIKSGIRNWSIITAYYARYNVIYSLLMKCGIKSEIHDCSIALIKYLFPELKESHEELEMSKQQRIDVQYYTDRTVEEKDFRKNVESAADFVLKIEDFSGKITQKDIQRAREKIKSLL